MPTVLPRCADRFAALCGWGERGGGRHDILRHRRRDAHRQAGNQQHADAATEGAKQQRRREQHAFQNNDLTAIVAIAQRCQQQNAQRIANLGQRRHQPDGTDARMQFVNQDAKHRLAVINRGDGKARAGGEHQDRAAGDAFFVGVGSLCDGHGVSSVVR